MADSVARDRSGSRSYFVLKTVLDRYRLGLETDQRAAEEAVATDLDHMLWWEVGRDVDNCYNVPFLVQTGSWWMCLDWYSDLVRRHPHCCPYEDMVVQQS